MVHLAELLVCVTVWLKTIRIYARSVPCIQTKVLLADVLLTTTLLTDSGVND